MYTAILHRSPAPHNPIVVVVTLELPEFQHQLMKDAMRFTLEVEGMNPVMLLETYLFQVEKEEQFLQQQKSMKKEMLPR